MHIKNNLTRPSAFSSGSWPSSWWISDRILRDIRAWRLCLSVLPAVGWAPRSRVELKEENENRYYYNTRYKIITTVVIQCCWAKPVDRMIILHNSNTIITYCAFDSVCCYNSYHKCDSLDLVRFDISVIKTDKNIPKKKNNVTRQSIIFVYGLEKQHFLNQKIKKIEFRSS